MDENLEFADFVRRLHEHQEVLEHVIECQYGLLTKLISAGDKILSRRQLAIVKQHSNATYTQNTELLKMLCQPKEKEAIGMFLQLLKETHQGHICNYILSDQDIEHDNRPLTEKECKALAELQNYFVDNLYITVGFLAQLNEVDCITEKHVTGVREHKENQNEQVATLLDILHCRSTAQLKKFVECCKKDHPHVHKFLLGEKGVITSVKIVIGGDKSADKKVIEAALFHEIKAMTKDELNELLSAVKKTNNDQSEVEVAGFAPNKCIRLYFYCPSLKALKEFHDNLDKAWRVIIESFFNQLLVKSHVGSVKVTHLYLIDYCECEKYLTTVQGEKQIQPESSQAIQHLSRCPDDLVEAILLKAFIHQTIAAKRISSRPKKFAYQSLCSVSKGWRSIARERKSFARKLGKYLTKLDDFDAKKVQMKNFDDQVTGITVNSEKLKLYVVHGLTSDTIHEYNLETFEHIQGIQIKGSKEVHIEDIVTAPSVDCLYASDSSNACVWRVIFVDGKDENKFEQMQISAKQVSLSQTGQLLTLSDIPPMLALFFDQRDTRHAVSRSYILLGEHMQHPLHVVQLKETTESNNYLISYSSENDGQSHGVCLVSELGGIEMAYDDVCGSGEMKLNNPCHIATDIEGHVFVADAGNHRVLMLDSNLSIIQVLVTQEDDGITNPTRLCYSIEHNLLYVGSDRQLSVYHVHPKASQGKLSAQPSMVVPTTPEHGEKSRDKH